VARADGAVFAARGRLGRLPGLARALVDRLAFAVRRPAEARLSLDGGDTFVLV